MNTLHIIDFTKSKFFEIKFEKGKLQFITVDDASIETIRHDDSGNSGDIIAKTNITAPILDKFLLSQLTKKKEKKVAKPKAKLNPKAKSTVREKEPKMFPFIDIEERETIPLFRISEHKTIVEISGGANGGNSNAMMTTIIDAFKPLHQLETIRWKIDYAETAWQKCFLDFFRSLDVSAYYENRKITIEWYFKEDDDQMETMGEDYQSRNLRALDFKFIEINE